MLIVHLYQPDANDIYTLMEVYMLGGINSMTLVLYRILSCAQQDIYIYMI